MDARLVVDSILRASLHVAGEKAGVALEYHGTKLLIKESYWLKFNHFLIICTST